MQSDTRLSSSPGVSNALWTMRWIQGILLGVPVTLNAAPPALRGNADGQAITDNMGMWASQCTRVTFNIEFGGRGPGVKKVKSETDWYILRVEFHIPIREWTPALRIFLNAWENDARWFVGNHN